MDGDTSFPIGRVGIKYSQIKSNEVNLYKMYAISLSNYDKPFGDDVLLIDSISPCRKLGELLLFIVVELPMRYSGVVSSR